MLCRSKDWTHISLVLFYKVRVLLKFQSVTRKRNFKLMRAHYKKSVVVRIIIDALARYVRKGVLTGFNSIISVVLNFAAGRHCRSDTFGASIW